VVNKYSVLPTGSVSFVFKDNCSTFNRTILLHEAFSVTPHFLFNHIELFLLGILCTPENQLFRCISITTGNDGIV